MPADRRVAKWIAIAETRAGRVRRGPGGRAEAAGGEGPPRPQALPRDRGSRRGQDLLFTGTQAIAALDSNLVRLGLAREAQSCSTTYRAGTAALAPYLGRGVPWLIRAHDLLRRHGEPFCDACPLADACPSAS
jgi:hypothetical protein